MSPPPVPDVPSSSQALPGLANLDTENLHRLLVSARDLGFLGPGDVDDQITRSVAFAVAAGVPAPTGLVADLGSGGGLPALVLALVWPDSSWLLIDSNQRRTSWLREASSVPRAGSRSSASEPSWLPEARTVTKPNSLRLGASAPLRQQRNAPLRCSPWEDACWLPTHRKAQTSMRGGPKRVSLSSAWS